MSQGVSVEFSTQPFPTPSINPVLQAALSSLDVQLEEELSRYRRQRAGRPVPPARGFGRHQTRKSIELIPVSTPGSSTQSPIPKTAIASPTSEPQLALVNQNPSAWTQASITQELRVGTGSVDASSSPSTRETLSSQITLTKSVTPEADYSAPVNPEPHSGDPTEPTEAASVGVGQPFPYARSSQPDDYLASSEQLLRSLADEEANVQEERSFLDSVLTPLGVGLMLLLLLSSATFGYIVMNPSIWAELGLNRFGKQQTPTVAQNPTQKMLAVNPSNQESPIVSGPNLASQEFVELNLNTLSSLKTNPGQSPTLVPRQQALPPVVIAANPKRESNSVSIDGHPSDLASALLPPSVSSNLISPRIPAIAPIPGLSATTRTPGTLTAKPKQTSAAMKMPSASRSGAQVAGSAAQLGKDDYYVLTNYDNDRSLEQVRKVVTDAYVRNFPEGARIQVATFTKESQAKKLIQQLQKQGISAWVYKK